MQIKMKLIKEHKVLVEYAECDAAGQKVVKPFLSPIYLRKGSLPLPSEITIEINI